MFATPAFAQAAGAPGETSMIAQFLPLILVVVIFYFLLIRPQQKRMKEHRTMVENLRRGDHVITAGGIFAKVTRVRDDERIEVEIAEGVKVDIARSTITAVTSKTEPASDA